MQVNRKCVFSRTRKFIHPTSSISLNRLMDRHRFPNGDHSQKLQERDMEEKIFSRLSGAQARTYAPQPYVLRIVFRRMVVILILRGVSWTTGLLEGESWYIMGTVNILFDKG